MHPAGNHLRDREPPGQGGIDLGTARLSISATNAKVKSVVRCTLTALNDSNYEGVPNHRIVLTVKGMQKRSSNSNANGLVSFTVRPSRGRAPAARCTTAVVDPNTEEKIILRTEAVALRLRAR